MLLGTTKCGHKNKQEIHAYGRVRVENLTAFFASSFPAAQLRRTRSMYVPS